MRTGPLSARAARRTLLSLMVKYLLGILSGVVLVFLLIGAVFLMAVTMGGAPPSIEDDSVLVILGAALRWAGPDGPGLDREGGGRGSSRNLWDHAKRVLSFPLPLNPPPRSNTAIVSERSSSPHLATLFSSDPISGSLLDWKMLRAPLIALIPPHAPTPATPPAAPSGPRYNESGRCAPAPCRRAQPGGRFFPSWSSTFSAFSAAWFWSFC